MATDTAYAIAEAYRWQRRLGNANISAPHCHIVADPAHPDVWAANHADDVTAQAGAEIDSVFRAMDRHLGHTSWRVIHTGLLYAQRVSRPPRARRLRGTPRRDPDWRRVAWPERGRGRPVRNPRRKARSAAASMAASRALHAGGHRRAQGDAGSHSGLPGGRPRSVGRARHKLRFRTLARRFLRLMAYHCLGLGLREARSFCEAPDPR